MQNQTSPFNADADYTQIPPIQQKRIITFVNHFVNNTISFLNDFCQLCESRFMDFEYKTQKIEASLLILEAQLSSIQGLEINMISKEQLVDESKQTATEIKPEVDIPNKNSNQETSNGPDEVSSSNSHRNGPPGTKVSEHPLFAKFFKMLKVGVQEEAVKLKMQSEGFNPSILDTPDEIIPETENQP